MVSEDKESKTERQKTGSAREEVAKARARFLEAAGTFEPLAIVRKYPFYSIGGAFAAGFGVNRIIKKLPYLSLLPLGVQIIALTTKLGLLAMDSSNKRP